MADIFLCITLADFSIAPDDTKMSDVKQPIQSLILTCHSFSFSSAYFCDNT